MTHDGTHPPVIGQAIIVVGMHRSGTSATAGALRCLGVELGQRLYTGHANINAKGYFEHRDIANANDDALLALGSSWDDILLRDDDWWRSDVLKPYARRIREYILRDFSCCPLWAVKDPRVCRLLPWWFEILAAEGITPRFLFVVRSAAAVSLSLQRRDGFSSKKAYLLWALHYLEAEHYSRGYPRAFLGYDRFLADPAGQFRRIGAALGLVFPVSLGQSAECLDAFVEHGLRHHMGSTDPETDDVPIAAICSEIERQFQCAEVGDEADLNRAVLDALWHQVGKLPEVAIDSTVVEHLRATAADRGQRALMIARIMRSRWWYLGKPIRFFERLFGREV
jgi:hypothetical protein